MGPFHCLLALLFGLVLAQHAQGQTLDVNKIQGSCYTGMAVLRLKPALSNCQDRERATRPLTSPLDLATDLPWDCLESLLVTVEGCKVSIIPTRNDSALLPGFACNWLEYRGYVDSTTSAQLAAWTRPISAAKWVLTNTNLTSWRQQGVATISVGSLMRALEHVQRRDPSLPISQLIRQQEFVALLKNFQNWNLQLDADEEANDQAISASSQQMKDRMAPGDIRLGKKLLQYNKHQQASAAGGHGPAPAPATVLLEQPPAAAVAQPQAAPVAAATGARDPATMPLVPQKQPSAREAQFFNYAQGKPAAAPAPQHAPTEVEPQFFNHVQGKPAAAQAAPQHAPQQVPGANEAQFFADAPAKAAAAAAPQQIPGANEAQFFADAPAKAAAAAPQQVPGANEAQFFMNPPGSTAEGATHVAEPQPAAAAAVQQPPGADEAQLFINPAPKSAPAPAAQQPSQKEPELVVDPPVFTADRPQGLPAAVAEIAEAAAAQAAAEAVPVKADKPPLPAGVQADVGNGLVSEPISWQKQLADMFKGNGSVLFADVPHNTIVLFNNMRCNLTYEIVSGGLLTLGEVDRSTVGKLAMPAILPYQEPYVLEVRGDALAQAAAGSSGSWLNLGNLFGPHRRSVTISTIVIISVLGVVLLGAVMVLVVKLAKAGKRGRDSSGRSGSAYDDGVRPMQGGRLSQRQPAGAGMSRLERHARPLGPQGHSSSHSSGLIPCLTWRRRK